MAVEIDINTVAKAYARWAPVYDFVFGAVFDAGRKASIAAAQRIGGRILDVGIGTGISLPDYAPAHRIVGVDYSEPMLRKAHERVAAHQAWSCRCAGGDGRAAPGLSRWLLRRGGGAIRHHHRARSGGGAGRVRARHQARRRDHPGQPSRRRGRATPRCSSRALRRWRAGSAGGRNSAGGGWRDGPSSTAECTCSSAARCRRSGISR